MTRTATGIATSLFGGLLMSCTLAVAASVYRWTDERGRVHYSDKPVAAAERVDIQPASGRGAKPEPVTEQAAAERAAACERRKSQRETYSRAEHVMQADGLGDQHELTPDELQRLRKQAEQSVREACGETP